MYPYKPCKTSSRLTNIFSYLLGFEALLVRLPCYFVVFNHTSCNPCRCQQILIETFRNPCIAKLRDFYLQGLGIDALRLSIWVVRAFTLCCSYLHSFQSGTHRTHPQAGNGLTSNFSYCMGLKRCWHDVRVILLFLVVPLQAHADTSKSLLKPFGTTATAHASMSKHMPAHASIC